MVPKGLMSDSLSLPARVPFVDSKELIDDLMDVLWLIVGCAQRQAPEALI